MKNLEDKAISLLNIINNYKESNKKIITYNFIDELKSNDIPCRYRIINELVRRDILARVERGVYTVAKKEIILLRQVLSALYDARAYFCDKAVREKIIRDNIVNTFNRCEKREDSSDGFNKRVAIEDNNNIIIADVLKLKTLKPEDECMVLTSDGEVKLLKVIKIISK